MERKVLVVSGIAAVAFAVIGIWLAWEREPEKMPPGDAPRHSPIPGPPDRPHVQIDDRNELLRLQHKDRSGNSPLELVNTPGGTVRIQRTFAPDGKLMKEEAFLDGTPVPIPATPVGRTVPFDSQRNE